MKICLVIILAFLANLAYAQQNNYRSAQVNQPAEQAKKPAQLSTQKQSILAKFNHSSAQQYVHAAPSKTTSSTKQQTHHLLGAQLAQNDFSAKNTTAKSSFTAAQKQAWFKSCLGSAKTEEAKVYIKSFCACGWEQLTHSQLTPTMLTSKHPDVVKKRSQILSSISQICAAEVMEKTTPQKK